MRFIVFRFKYSIIKSLCWLPCSRLHSNTQFEAKVRELLKDRLDLESRRYILTTDKEDCPWQYGGVLIVLLLRFGYLVCYCVHHAIMRVWIMRVFGVCYW